MPGTHLFVVPIYYRSLEKHASEMKRRKEKFVKEAMSEKYHLEEKEYERDFNRRYWLPWEYSQIVGYVEINLDHSGDLKAYYCFVNAKKVSDKLKNRTMKYCGKLFDVSKLNRSNEKIRRDIRCFLSILPSLRRRFKDRYFDTRSLEIILDAIDFSLIDCGRNPS